MLPRRLPPTRSALRRQKAQYQQKKGEPSSQMGSLSLIAGFRENSLTSIFKMSHAQVKQTKQSTAARDAESEHDFVRRIVGDFFHERALYLGFKLRRGVLRGCGILRSGCLCRRKRPRGTGGVFFRFGNAQKLKEKIADEIFCVERSVLARDRG